MKKILYFAISLGLALVVFLIVAAICVVLALDPTETASTHDSKPIETPVLAPSSTEVLCAFFDGERIFASNLNICFNKKTAQVETLQLSQDDLICAKNHGIYCFLGKCFEEHFENRQKFVVFDSKSFEKIADTCTGLVYNGLNNSPNLITGVKALELLDAPLFSSLCKQAVDLFLQSDFEKIFLTLCNTTRNNLSYPRFCDLTHP